ncbi:MAG TPA: ABC transporter permease, partial [Hyphomonadaceae bacterium]|nr:ABC transporter permease [Hyphomonadaceae bacterium]
LDEATSALDSNSEAKVQVALAALSGKRTIIVIAHRLATVRRASRIFVMADGRVAEAGAHDELVAKRGVYAGLAAHQLS